MNMSFHSGVMTLVHFPSSVYAGRQHHDLLPNSVTESYLDTLLVLLSRLLQQHLLAVCVSLLSSDSMFKRP